MKSAIDNKMIDLFFKEVLWKNILPRARLMSAFALGPGAVERFNYAKIDLPDTFDNYKGSKYFYNKEYLFIHYTSVKSVINILREKKIRLYDLNGMDDKNEFVQASQLVGKPLEEYFTRKTKSKIHCFSMSKYEKESGIEDLNLWRQYSEDGRGAAIVLRFNKECNTWVHFLLSQVYYSERDLNPMKNAFKDYEIFKEKYQFDIPNFDELFYRTFTFHKHPIYESEKEVRLLYSEGFKEYDTPQIKLDITKSNKSTTYVELGLEWEASDELLKISKSAKHIRPHITIEEIILGYRLSADEKQNIWETVIQLGKNYKVKPKGRNSGLDKLFRDS